MIGVLIWPDNAHSEASQGSAAGRGRYKPLLPSHRANKMAHIVRSPASEGGWRQPRTSWSDGEVLEDDDTLPPRVPKPSALSSSHLQHRQHRPSGGLPPLSPVQKQHALPAGRREPAGYRPRSSSSRSWQDSPATVDLRMSTPPQVTVCPWNCGSCTAGCELCIDRVCASLPAVGGCLPAPAVCCHRPTGASKAALAWCSSMPACRCR